MTTHNLRACLQVTALSLCLLGCGNDAALTADASVCTPGDTLDCSCERGQTGSALCEYGGQVGACSCEPAHTVPCSAPGESFACTCEGGARGTEVCLNSGAYTACACDGSLQTLRDTDSGIDPQQPAAISCPTSFSCVEQMGYEVCAQGSGIPPLCTSNADCTSAGLPAASCVDPGVGGVKLCVQPCQR